MLRNIRSLTLVVKVQTTLKAISLSNSQINCATVFQHIKSFPALNNDLSNMSLSMVSSAEWQYSSKPDNQRATNNIKTSGYNNGRTRLHRPPPYASLDPGMVIQGSLEQSPRHPRSQMA